MSDSTTDPSADSTAVPGRESRLAQLKADWDRQTDAWMQQNAPHVERLRTMSVDEVIASAPANVIGSGPFAELEMARRLMESADRLTSELVKLRESAEAAAKRQEAAADRAEAAVGKTVRLTVWLVICTVALIALTAALLWYTSRLK